MVRSLDLTQVCAVHSRSSFVAVVIVNVAYFENFLLVVLAEYIFLIVKCYLLNNIGHHQA